MWIKTNKLCKLNWVFALKSRINPNLKPQSIQAPSQELSLPNKTLQNLPKKISLHCQNPTQNSKHKWWKDGLRTKRKEGLPLWRSKKGEGDGRRGLPPWIRTKTNYVTGKMTGSCLAGLDFAMEASKKMFFNKPWNEGRRRRRKEKTPLLPMEMRSEWEFWCYVGVGEHLMRLVWWLGYFFCKC